jgi:hypothetical protein
MANTKNHNHCPCELQKHGPHIGLYCKPHKHWLKWLTKEETIIAINLGIKLANKTKKRKTTVDRLTIKDDKTIKNRLKRDKRWQQYKTNKGT